MGLGEGAAPLLCMLRAPSLSASQKHAGRAVLTCRCLCCNRWHTFLVHSWGALVNITFHWRKSVYEQIKVAACQMVRKALLKSPAGKTMGDFQSNRGSSGKAPLRGCFGNQLGVYEIVLYGQRDWQVQRPWGQVTCPLECHRTVSVLNIMALGPSLYMVVSHRHNTISGVTKFLFLPSPTLPVHGWLGSTLSLECSHSGQDFDS